MIYDDQKIRKYYEKVVLIITIIIHLEKQIKQRYIS